MCVCVRACMYVYIYYTQCSSVNNRICQKMSEEQLYTVKCYSLCSNHVEWVQFDVNCKH